MSASTDVEFILERIKSHALANQSLEMRKEILDDTTPVPFFGDYELANVISVGLNPSSVEFPAKKENRRLIHLSDLGLSKDHYQLAASEMSNDSALKIMAGCQNYFETNPYTWFDYAEMVNQSGFKGSFYASNKTYSRVCHTDVFPWATRRFASIPRKIQDEFKKENNKFLSWFLTRDKVNDLVVLGKQTWTELESEIPIKKVTETQEVGPNKALFEAGHFELGNKKARFFMTSQGPSVQFEISEEKVGIKKAKEQIHIAFGDFIARNRS